MSAPPQITLIPLDEIKPIEGLNPRQTITDDSIAELADSIKRHGVLMPVLVADRNGGVHNPLIAGHRRVLAARKAGLTEIPALVRGDLDGLELEAAITENAQREDLDPIEEGLALRRLMDDRGYTQAQAAEALGKSVRWARERLRLLKLPAHAQRIFAARQIPIEAAVQLEKVAKVSPELADLIAVRARQGKIRAGTLTDATGIGNALEAMVEAEDDRVGEVIVPARAYGRLEPADLPLPAEDRDRVAGAYEELPKSRQYVGAREERPPLLLGGDADIDAAREAGALLETDVDYYGGQSTVPYIAGGSWLADYLIETKFPRMRKAAQARARQAEKETEQRKTFRDKQKAETDRREAEEAAKREERQGALGELAGNLRGVEPPVDGDVGMQVIRLLCAVALGHEDALRREITQGLGRCDPQLLDDDPDEQVTSLADRFLDVVAAATTPAEAIAPVLAVIFGARYGPDPADHWSVLDRMGPEFHAELKTDALVDRLALELDVLPESLKAWATEQEAGRAEIHKEARRRAGKGDETEGDSK